jgi:hypothetical protein
LLKQDWHASKSRYTWRISAISALVLPSLGKLIETPTVVALDVGPMRIFVAQPGLVAAAGCQLHRDRAALHNTVLLAIDQDPYC